jgi:hypothetical protein
MNTNDTRTMVFCTLCRWGWWVVSVMRPSNSLATGVPGRTYGCGCVGGRVWMGEEGGGGGGGVGGEGEGARQHDPWDMRSGVFG